MLYIWRLESKLKSPHVYETAAKELALYCQAAPGKISDKGLGNAWYPKTIRDLDPFYGYISPKNANIVFTGGFYHLIYELNLDEDLSTLDEKVWNLFLVTEGSEQLLYTVRLKKEDAITTDGFIEQAVIGYDSDPNQATNKVIFLLVMNRPEMAYQACKELVLQKPEAWWPRLTLAFMEAARTSSQLAGNDFAQWVEEYPCFSHYFYLSFFYKIENDLDNALNAIEKSLDFPLQESVYSPDPYNVYYYTSDAILVVLHKEKYDLALRLCDAALAQLEQETGKYSSKPHWSPKFQKLRRAIEARDQETIDSWIQYRAWGGPFNPYQSPIQRIKVGSHFFPSEVQLQAADRPFVEVESLIEQWQTD